MIKATFSLCIASLLASGWAFGQQATPDLLQNIPNREQITLDGLWQAIVDPLENGYYNHRYQPREDGYFMNAKMQGPSDLHIEAHFSGQRALTDDREAVVGNGAGEFLCRIDAKDTQRCDIEIDRQVVSARECRIHRDRRAFSTGRSDQHAGQGGARGN